MAISNRGYAACVAALCVAIAVPTSALTVDEAATSQMNNLSQSATHEPAPDGSSWFAVFKASSWSMARRGSQFELTQEPVKQVSPPEGLVFFGLMLIGLWLARRGRPTH